jgi:hypothetical protein
MGLIVDSNEFRREKTSRYLRYDGIPSLSIGYSDFKYYTKPLITVLVDPSKEFISNLKLSDGTLYVIVAKTDRNNDLYKNFSLIVSNDGMVASEQILEIVNDKFKYDFKTDMINNIKIFDDEKDVSHGGARLKLCGREYRVFKFFFYNQRKQFTFDEIFGYLGLERKIKDETFSSYVMKINKKCKKVYRCKLIHKRGLGYEMINEGGISPDLFNPLNNIMSIQSE